MERLFTRREGRAFAQPNPPDGYVILNTHRTGGGGHRWYTYAQRGGFTSLEELFGKWKSEYEGLKTFPISIYKITSPSSIKIWKKEIGSFIGKSGRWIKAISAAIGKRVRASELRTIEFGSGHCLNTLIPLGYSGYLTGQEVIEALGEPHYIKKSSAPIQEHWIYVETELPPSLLSLLKQREEEEYWDTVLFNFLYNHDGVSETVYQALKGLEEWEEVDYGFGKRYRIRSQDGKFKDEYIARLKRANIRPPLAHGRPDWSEWK